MDMTDYDPAPGDAPVPTYTWKQALVLRTDLGMGKGKLVAQGAHVAVRACLLAPEAARETWMRDGEAKVVLKVAGEEDLLRVYAQAVAAGLPCAIVRDAGRTQIPAGTLTAVGIGPAEGDRIDAVVGGLKLL